MRFRDLLILLTAGAAIAAYIFFFAGKREEENERKSLKENYKGSEDSLFLSDAFLMVNEEKLVLKQPPEEWKRILAAPMRLYNNLLIIDEGDKRESSASRNDSLFHLRSVALFDHPERAIQLEKENKKFSCVFGMKSFEREFRGSAILRKEVNATLFPRYFYTIHNKDRSSHIRSFVFEYRSGILTDLTINYNDDVLSNQ